MGINFSDEDYKLQSEKIRKSIRFGSLELQRPKVIVKQVKGRGVYVRGVHNHHPTNSDRTNIMSVT